jgi:hypothetical protein
VPGYRNPIDSTSLLRPPVAPHEVCAVNSAVSELIANTLLVVGAFVSDCQPARADPHPAIVVYPRVYRCVDFMERAEHAAALDSGPMKTRAPASGVH